MTTLSPNPALERAGAGDPTSLNQHIREGHYEASLMNMQVRTAELPSIE